MEEEFQIFWSTKPDFSSFSKPFPEYISRNPRHGSFWMIQAKFDNDVNNYYVKNIQLITTDRLDEKLKEMKDKEGFYYVNLDTFNMSGLGDIAQVLETEFSRFICEDSSGIVEVVYDQYKGKYCLKDEVYKMKSVSHRININEYYYISGVDSSLKLDFNKISFSSTLKFNSQYKCRFYNYNRCKKVEERKRRENELNHINRKYFEGVYLKDIEKYIQESEIDFTCIDVRFLTKEEYDKKKEMHGVIDFDVFVQNYLKLKNCIVFYSNVSTEDCKNLKEKIKKLKEGKVSLSCQDDLIYKHMIITDDKVCDDYRYNITSIEMHDTIKNKSSYDYKNSFNLQKQIIERSCSSKFVTLYCNKKFLQANEDFQIMYSYHIDDFTGDFSNEKTNNGEDKKDIELIFSTYRIHDNIFRYDLRSIRDTTLTL